MTESETFTPNARRLGIVSAGGTVLLMVVYAVTLAAGFLSLRSPQEPIGEPFFSLLEILIILMMPFMVGLMVAVHAWAALESKVFSLIALIFMALVAGLTCSLHFVILTVGQHASMSGLAWMPSLISFTWPSVAYALDILAWDVFFAISALFASLVFSGSRFNTLIRALLLASSALALAGLSGVFFGNMQLRNLGIVGYVGIFPVVALMLGIVFYRDVPRSRRGCS